MYYYIRLESMQKVCISSLVYWNYTNYTSVNRCPQLLDLGSSLIPSSSSSEQSKLSALVTGWIHDVVCVTWLKKKQEMLSATQKRFTSFKARNTRWSLKLSWWLQHFQIQNPLFLVNYEIFTNKTWSLPGARDWTKGPITQNVRDNAFVRDSCYRLVILLIMEL